MRILLLVALFVSTSFGLVSLQNGNYYFEIKPIEFPKTSKGDFKLLMSYNSRSISQGLFGWGWGTEFETRLVPLPEGAVVIHEIGGADGNRYVSRSMKASTIRTAVGKIMKAANRKGKNFRNKLLTDAEFRGFMAEKYKIKGNFKKGEKLYNFRKKQEIVTVTKDGFRRDIQSEDRQEYFDKFGRLYLIRRGGGSQIQIFYDKKGKITAFEDANKRRINIKMNDKKLVTEASTSLLPNRRVQFSYSSRGDLVSIKQADGKTTKFEYDPLHNLRVISFSDGTQEKIRYDRSGNWTTEVVNRAGKSIQYQQWFNPKDRSKHMKQTLSIKEPGEKTRIEVYEYWKKTKAGGELWLSKMKSTIGGEIITRYYDEKLGDDTRHRYFLGNL